jgi:hypothetical protein
MRNSPEGRRSMSGATASFIRPNVFDRIFGRVLTGLVSIGLIRGHFYVLEVRGRKTGNTISMPVYIKEEERSKIIETKVKE